MIVTLNRPQKIAILKSLIYIISADGNIAPTELECVQKYINDYRLDAEAIKDQLKMSYAEMVFYIKNIPYVQREKEVSRLWNMAVFSDNKIGYRKELDLFYKLMKDCEIEISSATISANKSLSEFQSLLAAISNNNN